MHLTPREVDKLLISSAGELASRRRARGVKLNHPEAVALITSEILELIRDGKSVAEIMSIGPTIKRTFDVHRLTAASSSSRGRVADSISCKESTAEPTRDELFGRVRSAV